MAEMIQLRLPAGKAYEVHEFDPTKSYIVFFDPVRVNEDDLDAAVLAAKPGLNIMFVPAIPEAK